MGKRKRLARIQRQFGAVPDSHYYYGELEETSAYSAYRKSKEPDVFYLDDITWRDLSMDEVYKRINNTLSTSGEQVLYYQLRRPALNENEFITRKNLIGLMEEAPLLRQELQLILLKLGKSRYAKLTAAYRPDNHRPFALLVCIAAVLVFLLGIALLPMWDGAKPLLIVSVLTNLLLHTIFLKRIARELDTVQYSVSMVIACHRIDRLRDANLSTFLPDMLASGKKASSLRRHGGVTAFANNDLAQIVNTLLLVDIISFELTKNKLARYHNEIFQIHEGLGQLDAAISIASYRISAQQSCVPVLHFQAQGHAFIRATGLVHPLIQAAVPNDIDTGRSILLTGSNASGKSTYLKGVILSAILAQAIATAPCKTYEAAAFRIYTSMAIHDNVIEGDSYFVAEIKSLKRIMDNLQQPSPMLCGIDEVLRGTNTIERIAASSELLGEIASMGALCIAATHDIELCGILESAYTLYHFEEQVEGAGVTFDYRLRDGPSITRNAIKLLEVLGIQKAVVTRSEQRAERFLASGQWQAKE